MKRQNILQKMLVKNPCEKSNPSLFFKINENVRQKIKTSTKNKNIDLKSKFRPKIKNFC